MPLWAIGLSVENVGTSQGKCKTTMRWEKLAVFGLLFGKGPQLTISCQERSLCFENFPMFLVFLCPDAIFNILACYIINFCPFFRLFYYKYNTIRTQYPKHYTPKHSTSTAQHSLRFPTSVVFLMIHDKLLLILFVMVACSRV